MIKSFLLRAICVARGHCGTIKKGVHDGNHWRCACKRCGAPLIRRGGVWRRVDRLPCDTSAPH